jgi:hypothetical protein
LLERVISAGSDHRHCNEATTSIGQPMYLAARGASAANRESAANSPMSASLNPARWADRTIDPIEWQTLSGPAESTREAIIGNQVGGDFAELFHEAQDIAARGVDMALVLLRSADERMVRVILIMAQDLTTTGGDGR